MDGLNEPISKQIGDSYVPLEEKYIEWAIDFANVQPGEKLIDLGCGDGRLVVAARKRGIDAYGCDLAPDKVALSTSELTKESLIAPIIQEDYMKLNWADYDVILLNLDPTESNKNEILKKWEAEKKKGERLIWMNGPTEEDPFILYT